LTRDEIARQIRVNITLFGQCSWVQLGSNAADIQNTQHSAYDNNPIHAIWRWWSGNGIGLAERRHQDTSCTDESQQGWHPTRLRAWCSRSLFFGINMADILTKALPRETFVRCMTNDQAGWHSSADSSEWVRAFWTDIIISYR
jgi:hypothetical protein